jgi:hypothetical protein
MHTIGIPNAVFRTTWLLRNTDVTSLLPFYRYTKKRQNLGKASLYPREPCRIVIEV